MRSGLVSWLGLPRIIAVIAGREGGGTRLRRVTDLRSVEV
jgi:hypothetical protein